MQYQFAVLKRFINVVDYNYFKRMEEEMYWDGRDYYDWRGRPGLMPPRPFMPGAGPMGVR